MNGGQGAEGFRGLDKKIASKIQERSPDVVEYDGVSGVAYRFKKNQIKERSAFFMRKLKERIMTVLLAVFTWGLAAVPAYAQAIAPVGADELASKLVNAVKGVVQPIGMVVIFAVVAWTSFKLITTANNPTERGETMKSLPFILLGGVALGAVMLAAGFIVSIMKQVGG